MIGILCQIFPIFGRIFGNRVFPIIASKLFNYDFVTIKEVDAKHLKKARTLVLAKFSNLSYNNENNYKYTHSSGMKFYKYFFNNKITFLKMLQCLVII